MTNSSSAIVETIHTLPVSEVYSSSRTRPQGLSEEEADLRLGQVSRNTLQEIKGKPLYLKFLSNFTHLKAILLWIGGLVAFFAQMPQLGVAVWMVNIIHGVLAFWQEYRAEKATEALKRLLPSTSRVLRDGEEKVVLAEELVPGDVILLAEGDRVSADARLVQELCQRHFLEAGRGRPDPGCHPCDTGWISQLKRRLEFDHKLPVKQLSIEYKIICLRRHNIRQSTNFLLYTDQLSEVIGFLNEHFHKFPNTPVLAFIRPVRIGDR